ncbi:hypothetical protein Ddye_000140 [Dipteronia dyeriana]|uniref:RING-type E3 ubiquitin transferase n=1 Tax=Dipteronia dyeriana TaxID=168575 RepID=A0AAD9XLM3_9ROSI|nr:hypothetical protein Ddye_000140 [Dipteronia dyeriana]
MVIVEEESKASPQEQKQQNPVAENGDGLFSPRFKSVAAMAGWDEEAILVAALVVEDTPDRLCKHKKRTGLQFKTPPSNSRRKRRAQRRSPVSVPIVVLDLDEEQSGKGESEQTKVEVRDVANEEKITEEEKKTAGDELKIEDNSGVSCSNSALPCIDKLREELSCAICLEICYEPSTTTCGHSFCKKCLRSAADKCGKRCPKCRQLISNGRSCTVNTVLWNTIQLLFPQEVESRKAGGALNNPEENEHRSPARGNQYNVRTRSSRPSLASTSSQTSNPRRRGIPSQDEDAEHRILGRGIHNNVESPSVRLASVLHRDGTMRRRGRPSQDEVAATALRLERENLARLLGRDGSVRRWRSTSNEDGDEDAVFALRLQREEFMDAFIENPDQSNRTSLSLARSNLRAMASRAINIRTRRHPV